MGCCPVCEGESTLLYAQLSDILYEKKGKWDYWTCKNCKLIWLNIHGILHFPENFYNNYYTHTKPASIGFFKYFFQLALPATLIRTPPEIPTLYVLLAKTISFIGPLREIGKRAVLFQGDLNNKRILDFGCGTGEFLWKFKYFNCNIHGVEPDSMARKIARNILKSSNIFPDIAHLVPGSFDLISMIHVIEHLPNPLNALQSIKPLLSPGGKVVIATPNSASMAHKIFKKYWRGLEPPTHFHLFNQKNLKTLVKQSGFDNIRTFTICSFSLYMFKSSIYLTLNRSPLNTQPLVLNVFTSFVGLCFWALEYSLNLFFKDLGEELFLIAET